LKDEIDFPGPRSDSLKRTPRAERPGEMGLVDAS
jgi:hypothetical protein